MSVDLIIFDLDGTLVDSEILSLRAFKDLIPELPDPIDVLLPRYRGQKLSRIIEDLQERYKVQLPERFEDAYRSRVQDLFDQGLKPTPNTLHMLESIDRPICVASSGPISKIRHALEVTKLASFFGENVFSSYEIGSWKPEPGLFLHAAERMNCPCHNVLVVEDSAVGLQAAENAGMRACLYSPARPDFSYDEVQRIRDMGELRHLVSS